MHGTIQGSPRVGFLCGFLEWAHCCGHLTGVHGFHISAGGVPLDAVKDGGQLRVGADLRLELAH